jgi:outer membrane protein assembly factor BamB
VYVGYQAASDPIELTIDRIDLATGTVTGTSPALGSAFTTLPAADEGGLILGVRVASSTGRAPEAMIRLADDGEGLGEDWRLTFDADNPFTVDDEEFREHFGFTTFAVAGDAVVGYARGRLLSVARSSGTPAWAHDAAGTNNHDRLAVDTAGRTYFSSFGGYWLRSLSADGTVLWEIEAGAPVVPAALTEASRVGPVTKDGAVIIASREEQTGIIHVVALDLDEIP